MKGATTGEMIFALFCLIVAMGLAMALRPKRVTSVMLRNSPMVLSERFIRHYTSSVRIVGIAWILFGSFMLAIVLRDAFHALP